MHGREKVVYALRDEILRFFASLNEIFWCFLLPIALMRKHFFSLPLVWNPCGYAYEYKYALLLITLEKCKYAEQFARKCSNLKSAHLIHPQLECRTLKMFTLMHENPEVK